MVLVQEVTGGADVPVFAAWPGTDALYCDVMYPYFPPCAKDNERQPYFSECFACAHSKICALSRRRVRQLFRGANQSEELHRDLRIGRSAVR